MQFVPTGSGGGAVRPPLWAAVAAQVPGVASGPLIFQPQPEDGGGERLRERLRRDREHSEQLADFMRQERTTDVIRNDERAVSTSSRAFRRELLAAHQQGRSAAAQAAKESAEATSAGGNSEWRIAKNELQSPEAASQSVVRDTPTAVSSESRPMHESGMLHPMPDKHPSSPLPDGRGSASQPPAPPAPPMAEQAGPYSALRFAAAAVARIAAAERGAAMSPPTPAASSAATAARDAAPVESRGGAAPPAAVGGHGQRTAAGAPAAARKADGGPANTAETRQNIERMVRVLRLQVDSQRSSTTLRLDPPELGSLRLKLDLEKDALTLRVETQTHAAHRLLSDSLDALRRGLDAAGIQLERVEIRPPQTVEQPAESPAERPDDEEAGRRPVPQGQDEWAGHDGGDETGDAGETADEAAGHGPVGKWPAVANTSAAEPHVNVLA